jgi:hypothetical protein
VSGGAVTGVSLLVAAVLLMTVLYLLAKRHAPPELDDDTGNSLVAGLTEELRKWQAEARHWKATAERLQRELDQR